MSFVRKSISPRAGVGTEITPATMLDNYYGFNRLLELKQGTGVIKLGSAIVSMTTQRSTTSTTYVDVTGATYTGDLSGKLLLITIGKLYCPLNCNNSVFIQLLEDAVQKQELGDKAPAESVDCQRYLLYEVPLGTGSKTYKLQWKNVVGGSALYINNIYFYAISLGT